MEPELFENLPPEWLAFAAEWAPYVLGTLVLTTAAAHLLLPLARKLETWAVVTAATWDDDLTRWLVVGLEWVVTTSRTVMEWLPILARAGATKGKAGAALRGPRTTEPEASEHVRAPLPWPEPPAAPPPPRPPSDGALALVLAVLAAVMSVVSSGCGGESYRAHTQAHAFTSGAVTVGGAVVDEARDAALDRVEAEHPVNGEARSAALDAEAAKWNPAGAALDATREALVGWAEAIEAARVAEMGELDLMTHLAPIVARVVRLYGNITKAVEGLDVDLPELPRLVRELADGLLRGRE